MTTRMPNRPDEAAIPPAALDERLIYLKQRAGDCRRSAQSCKNLAVAATLSDMAARYEAEIMLLAPSAEQQ